MFHESIQWELKLVKEKAKPFQDLSEIGDDSLSDTFSSSFSSSRQESQSKDHIPPEFDIVEVENACSNSLRRQDIFSALLSVFRYLEYVEKSRCI